MGTGQCLKRDSRPWEGRVMTDTAPWEVRYSSSTETYLFLQDELGSPDIVRKFSGKVRTARELVIAHNIYT